MNHTVYIDMCQSKFKKFLEAKYANFGFEEDEEASVRERLVDKQDDSFPDPVIRLDLEELTDLVAKHQVGVHKSIRLFFDHVQWGTDPGAVRLWFGTKYDVIIERMENDLKGHPTWITKKIFNINKEYYSNKEPMIASELIKEIRGAYNSPHDSPMREYKDFFKLVKGVADRSSRTANKPLFYEGIRKISENNYIIHFGVGGHGVQAPDQQRVEKVYIDLSFDPHSGVIKLIETNIESPLSRHEWGIMPADFMLRFMPSQSGEEIISNIATIMKYY